MVYKWCVVPQCTNTSVKSPQKLFLSVPKAPRRRNKWLTLARRDPKSVESQSTVFMCEDHFCVEKDIVNYMRYKMGFSHKLLLADEAVPSKFDCQGDPVRLPDGSTPQRNHSNEKLNMILKCCINLVKVHGRPVEMFDDLAFRELIELIDVPEEDRSAVSTQYVSGLIDADCEDAGSYSEQPATDASEADDAGDDAAEVVVKVEHGAGEGEGAGEEEGEAAGDVTQAGGDVTHGAGRVAAEQQPFWNYFETSLDAARCALCGRAFSWRAGELRAHLRAHHPDLPFSDHGPPNIPLQDEDTSDSPTRSKKRRKNPEEDRTCETEVFNRLGNKILDSPKEVSNTVVTLNDKTEVSLDSFKSLDRFGLYVASLMSALTKEKRLKYQEHIIHILLKEQAAAG